MIFFVQVLISVILVVISYNWYKTLRVKKMLHWVPVVPGLPILGNVLELGDSSKTLDVMKVYTEQYNGLCRLHLVTQTQILVSNSEFLSFLLPSMQVLNKSVVYKFLNKWLGTGLLTADDKKWKKNRKIITPTFHFSILEQFVVTFESNGEIMVSLLENELDNDSVDIFPYVTMCTLDIICETAMGVSINAQKNQYSDYVYAVKEMCRIVVDRAFSPIKMFNILYPLSKDFYKERKYVRTLHTYTNSVIASRKKELQQQTIQDVKTDDDIGVKRKIAFLDLLLQASADGHTLSDTDLREEVDTFMFEGHDTTASAISFALHSLATNPEVQALAFEEQKQLFANDPNRTAGYRDLQEMKYLELVIKETLRLYPSVPFYARRVHKDVKYKEGQVIPEGTQIIIFAFGANRNPKYYPDPDKFDPDRFRNNEGTNPYAYIPFSAGPRNCIGQKFAMLEVKSVVSKILRKFELLSGSQGDKLTLVAETVLKPANGIHVKLRRRKWV